MVRDGEERVVVMATWMQAPEIRKYKRKFNGEILCGALWGVNLLVGTDNGLLLLDRSGHGKGVGVCGWVYTANVCFNVGLKKWACNLYGMCF